MELYEKETMEEQKDDGKEKRKAEQITQQQRGKVDKVQLWRNEGETKNWSTKAHHWGVWLKSRKSFLEITDLSLKAALWGTHRGPSCLLMSPPLPFKIPGFSVRGRRQWIRAVL